MQLRLIDFRISFLNLIMVSPLLGIQSFFLWISLWAGIIFLSAYSPFIGSVRMPLASFIHEDMIVMLSFDSLSWSEHGVKSALEPVWCQLLILHRFLWPVILILSVLFFRYCISHCKSHIMFSIYSQSHIELNVLALDFALFVVCWQVSLLLQRY